MTQIASSARPAPTLGTTAKPVADPSLAKAAQQFEAIFLRQMIGAMRSSSLSEGLLDSSATEQFRDMADARTADTMAQTGGLGVSTMLIRQLSRQVSPPVAAPAAASAYADTASTAAPAEGKTP